MANPNKLLLICDLDDTLYDWVSYFVPSFYAMVDVATEIMGCDREQLLDDLRNVHQHHHDSEQPFALLETKTVQELYRGHSLGSISQILDPAFHAFNSSRKRTLKLNDGVIETLDRLAGMNVKLIAHTESRLQRALDRLNRLGIFKYFSRIYCRERTISRHPNPDVADRWLETFSLENVRELSHDQSKPNPEVLIEICATEDIPVDHAAYIGDSIARDILMAKRAGVFAIWAAYGAKHNRDRYASLVRISHWTANDIAREHQLRLEAASINPDYVAEKSFSEVLAALNL